MKNFIIAVFLIISPALCAGANKTDASSFATKLVAAAKARIGVTIYYDPAYVRLNYPGGDVSSDRGVCIDVVIRAYRKLGIDLQKLIHEDMRRNFRLYPKYWGLKNTDKNIDHRRVPNMAVFLKRQKADLPITNNPDDYLPGDLVTWNLRGKVKGLGLPHIGIVSDRRTHDNQRPLIIHNIGSGTCEEDVLLSYHITGHYRFNNQPK